MVLTFESLIFCLLFISYQFYSIINILRSSSTLTASNLIILSLTLNLIILLSYLKIRIISVLFYIIKSESENVKYKRINGLISILIYLLTFIFIFIIQDIIINVFGVFTIVFLFLVSYFEQKRGYVGSALVGLLYLTLTCIMLGLISFSVIPLFWKRFTLNLQLTMFLILLYLSLEPFKKYNLFAEHKIIISQNFISVVLFFLISYSIYPFFMVGADIVLNIYVAALLFFLSLLLSFYRLFNLFFKDVHRKVFSSGIIANFAMLDLFILLTVHHLLRFQYNIILDFYTTILVFGLSFFIILMAFIELNSRFDIVQDGLHYHYYTIWVLIPFIFVLWLCITVLYTLDLFINIFGLSLFLVSLLSDIIFLCFAVQYQVKFGLSLKKIVLKMYKQLLNANTYIVSFGLATIVFLILSLIPSFDFFLIIFFSLLTLSLTTNLSSISENVSVQKFCLYINSLFFFYIAILCAYLSVLFAYGTFYIIHLPSIGFSFILDLPILYIRAKMKAKKTVNTLLWVNNILLSLLLVSFPYIIALDLIRLGFMVDFLTSFNFSIFILLVELLAFSAIIKKLGNNQKKIKYIQESEILTLIILTGTAIFYYSFTLLSGLYLGILIPFIISSCFLYIPLIISHKRLLFNRKVIDNLILFNTIFLAACILGIPTSIAVEFANQGTFISPLFIIVPTLSILFLFGKLITYLTQTISISIKLQAFVHIALIINWFFISFFLSLIVYSESSQYLSVSIFNANFSIIISIPLSLLLFFCINLHNIQLIRSLRAFSETSLKRDRLKLTINQFLPYYLFFNFYGVIISFSFILSFKFLDISVFLLEPLKVLNFFLIFVLFCGLFNPLNVLFSRNQSYKPLKNRITLFSILSLFFSTIIIYIELFWSIYLLEVASLTNSLILFITSLLLVAIFCFQKWESFKQDDHFLQSFYLSSIEIIFVYLSILWIGPIFIIPMIFLLNIIFLSKRTIKSMRKWILYLILSLIGYLKIIIFTEKLSLFASQANTPYGVYIILYFINLIAIFGCSILINREEQNSGEKFALNLIISALTLTFLLSFTNILLIYGVTVSAFLFLFLFGVDYYIKGDRKYKLFIKPLVIIFVFNLISWISYTFLFVNPQFNVFNIILTFSLTISITALAFIVTYKDLVEPLRKTFFFVFCFSLTIFIPLFVYTLSVSYFQVSFSNPILLIISINIAFVLTYVSISIYYWEISWEIWRVGWYLWLIIPIVNSFLINRLILGIDLYTEAVKFFGMFDLTGSFIFTFIISTLFYIPVFYSKLKKYFYEIVIMIWSESLFLTYWIAHNLFCHNIILSNLFFGLTSVFLILPIIWKLKFWTLLSFLWLALTILNCSFLSYLFLSLNFLPELVISINIIVGSIFLLIFSRFPSVGKKKSTRLLIFSYFTTILGIFLFIFFIFLQIFLNPIISMNLAFLIITGTLFTSKYIQVNKKITRFMMSLIFIINISSFVFFTFIIIPGMLLFSLFFAASMFFGSLLLFNHFGFLLLIRKFNYAIFWVPLGFSLSLCFTLFLSIFIPSNIFLLIGLLILINIIFLQRILDRFVFGVFFLYPLSFAFLLLEMVVLFESLSNYLILIWLIFYLVILQLLINGFHYFLIKSETKVNPFLHIFFMDRRKLILLNIICFCLFFLNLSLLCSLLIFHGTFFHIFAFFILFPFFTLLNLYYAKINSKIIDYEHINIVLEFGGWILYSIIPVFSGLLIFFHFLSPFITFLYTINIFFLSLFCMSFIEIFFDKYVFKFLSLNQDSPYSHKKILSLLGYLIYLQIDSITFLLMVNYIGILEALIIFIVMMSLIPISDIYLFNHLGKRLSFSILACISFIFSILGLILLLSYSYSFLLFIKLDILAFISSLFLTNYLYTKSKSLKFERIEANIQGLIAQERINNIHEFRKRLIGISFYITLITFIQEAALLIIGADNLIFNIFIVSMSLFVISGVDKYFLTFFGRASEYFMAGSWIFLMIISNLLITNIYSSVAPALIFKAIPMIIFILNIELICLFELLTFLSFIEKSLLKIRKSLIRIIYIDLVSFPLYYLTFKFLILDFNLLILSLVLLTLISKIDDLAALKAVNQKSRSKILNYTVFVIIHLISIDLLLFLELLIRPLLPIFHLLFNLNISLLILFILYAFFFKIFKTHSRGTFIFWNLIFISFSLLIFQLTLYLDIFPLFFGLASFIVPLLLYPFIFLMEKLRNLFNVILEGINVFFKTIIRKITDFFNNLKGLFKHLIANYWIYLLAVVCMIIDILSMLVLIFILNFSWFNSILTSGGFALSILFSIYSYKSSIEDPNKALKFKMLYLGSICSTILGVIFNFLSIEFYLIAFFLSLVILGVIILPYIYYKEKKEEISIKWRFFSTIIFISILIITFILIITTIYNRIFI